MHKFLQSNDLSQKADLNFLEKYPSLWETVSFLSGDKIQVRKYSMVFKEWRGDSVLNTYGNKAVIDWKGEPVFAELAVLRLFQESGWDGVWVDSYRRKFRIGIPSIVDPVQLPVDKKKLIDAIKTKAGASGGCWDVFIWKGIKILFVELKRQKKDRLQDSQYKWLKASIGVGLKPSNFAIIEWDLIDEVAGE